MLDRVRTARHMRLAHRTTSLLVASFAVVHLTHHVVALNSIDAHFSVAMVLRVVYRNAWFEPFLLLAVAAQWATGLMLAYRRWQSALSSKRVMSRAQAWSGVVLSFFLPVHVLSVLQGRASGLDTNFYFAAAGLHTPVWAPWFALYYLLAVMAIVLHLYIAVMGRIRAAALWPIAAASGALCGTLLVLALAGHLHPFEIPASHRLHSTGNPP